MQVPSIFSRVLPDDLLSNPPVLSLIAANIVTIALAILGNWDVATVMFIYWAQSIIIGFFTVVTLLLAQVPPAPEQQPPDPKPGGQRTIEIRNPWTGKAILAGFFTVHYGIFHWGYYTFIVESGMFGAVNFSDPGLWLSCGMFFVNHLYSFVLYRRNGMAKAQNIGDIFFRPYRRIFPMHMTIIFGGILLRGLELLGIRSTLPVLVLFLVLKTASDVSAHVDKHALPETPEDPASGL
jgi:hypothetical protein